MLSEFSCEIDGDCDEIGGISCDTVTNDCRCKPGWYSSDCSGIYDFISLSFF